METTAEGTDILTRLMAIMESIEGRLDRFCDFGYQSKVTSSITGIIGKRTGLRRAKILMGLRFTSDPDYQDLLERAETAGALTEAEIDDLMLSDVIAIAAGRSTGEPVYAVAEVSITATDDDIDRAADRAGILRKISGAPVIAMVIAETVNERQEQLAAIREVTVAVYRE